MSLFTWLQHRTRRLAGHQRRAQRSPRRQTTVRPQLEVLEGREVPSTLTVTNNLDNLALGSLRYEIAAAQSGDTIVFDKSLKGQTITLFTGELHINRSLTIKGPGANQLWITSAPYINGALESSPGSRLFEVDANTTVTLSGLGLINGGGTAVAGGSNHPYDGYGGAILNFGTLTLSGVTVGGNDSNGALAGNFASNYGGGIANFGIFTLSNSTVSNNSLSLNAAVANQYGVGGGIYNVGTLMVSGSSLTYNAALNGGGIYNAGTATVEKSSTLSANNAGADGGGIDNAGTLTVTGSTLSGNRANNGGGIYNATFNAAMVMVSNSIFSQNLGGNIVGGFTDGGRNQFYP